jgi:hypothetical protein
MVAEHVELALLEDSFLPVTGLQPPFSDRMASIAERTGGALLFDVRIFGDTDVERIAAIAYGTIGTAIAVLMKGGAIKCLATGNRDVSDYLDALTAWSCMPMSEQIATDYTAIAGRLLAKLREAGRLDQAVGWPRP